MARPCKQRYIGGYSRASGLAPAGFPERTLETIVLSLDGLEAIRLADVDGDRHDQAAAKMGISRPTFSRILDRAHRVVAEAILDGKALRIEGGVIAAAPRGKVHCRRCLCTWDVPVPTAEHFRCPHCPGEPDLERAYTLSEKEPVTMDPRNCTIAFVTDDGVTVSSHFGRAQFYELITLKDGVVAERVRVPKAGHHAGDHAHHEGHHDSHHDADIHARMGAPLAGVSILVSRGMGMGAHQYLLGVGVKPVLTGLQSIDEAVAAFLAGTLEDDPRRLHAHGGAAH